MAMKMLIFFLVGGICASYLEEKIVHEKVLNGYNIYVRPQKEDRKPVDVFFDFRMQKLVSLDVRTQTLTLNAFTMMRWNDPQLQWEKHQVNGTDRVNMDSSIIWTPDVVLYNTANEKSQAHTDIYKSRPLVFSSGTVIWNSPVTWKISCEMDITWFPVDRQECNFTFGSNSYSKFQLKMKFWSKPSSKDDLFSGNFRFDSGEWDIKSLNAFEEDTNSSCCPEPFSSIKYQLVITRMSLYYFLYIILPLISLAFLFLLVFHIPHDSGERMGFGVTILLSITVYLLVISEKLPEKSDVYPMLGICFIVIFYILCGALGCAAITTILARRVVRPPEFLLGWVTNKTVDRKCTSKFKPKVEHKSSSFHCPAQPTKQETEEAIGINHNDGDEVAKQEDYTPQWVKICRKADKRMYIVFNILLVAVPLIIILALPKSGLA